MTILFVFLLLDLMAHNNMHKTKAAVPSCEQSNLIFAEVDLRILGGLEDYKLSLLKVLPCMYTL